MMTTTIRLRSLKSNLSMAQRQCQHEGCGIVTNGRGEAIIHCSVCGFTWPLDFMLSVRGTIRKLEIVGALPMDDVPAHFARPAVMEAKI